MKQFGALYKIDDTYPSTASLYDFYDAVFEDFYALQYTVFIQDDEFPIAQQLRVFYAD